MFICENCNRKISNEGGYVRHKKSCDLGYKFYNKINKLYEKEKYSIREISSELNLSKNLISNILKNPRTLSESTKIAHKKYPERFKHSDETREKLRKARLKFMKENPSETAWRKTNLSYPEKLFLKEIKDRMWDKTFRIEREYSVFPYFIDFALLNEMVAIEIDGSQHLLKDRQENDKKKDALLNKNGWTVIRITENEVKKNIDDLFDNILKILNNSEKVNKYSFGVFKSKKKKYKLKERKYNGLTEKEYLRSKEQRKVKRPSYETLLDDIDKLGYIGTGRKYNVSDNSVRKWKKFYEKYEIEN